tara:strand:- start:1437 stop:2018 length:582 start_codon:yes stop_codon:yes gene_type:complete
MFLLLSLLSLAGEPPATVAKETIIVEDAPEEIYIDDATIDDKTGRLSPAVINAIISGAAAQYAHHYFNVDNYEPFIFDKSSNEYEEDCDYEKNAQACSRESEHWIVKTHIQLTDEVLNVVMKIYDPTGRLRASSANTEIIKTVCRQPPRRRVPHPTQGSVAFDPPEECKEVNPRLVSPSLRQSIKILLSNVRP